MELINWLLDLRERNNESFKTDITIKKLIELHLENLTAQPTIENWLDEISRARFCLKHMSPSILGFSVSRIKL